MDEFQTLALLEEGMSIARFGDGELNLCHGAPAKCQKPNSLLADRLKEILATSSDKCLVGIPRIGPGAVLPDRKEKFWAQYRSSRFTDLYRLKNYASAFITRPDSAPVINVPDYWERIKGLWKNRKILIVEGQSSTFGQNKILQNAAEVETLKCPDSDSFASYSDILSTVKNYRCSTIILSLGPTATVLAWDLSHLGYRALDLGHLSFLYDKCFVRGLEH